MNDPLSINRRSFLDNSFAGLGGIAFASLMQKSMGDEAPWPGVFDNALHFAPKAKRVIHLCMAGGPSQFESFDYKPELQKIHGQPFPESFTKGQQLAQLQGSKLIARGPSTKFAQYGQSGIYVSEIFPHMAKQIDHFAVINSMTTEQINHDPAHAFFNSGSIVKGRPSMGSWVLYGLGAETSNLPGYIVLMSVGGGAQPVSARQWSSGFLPGKFQGVQFQSNGAAVHYLGNPEGICQSTQRQVVDEVKRMNGLLAESRRDPEITARISQYEMAFRMQSSVPGLTELGDESKNVLDLYGITEPNKPGYARNCLLARRMVERGVRFVQLYHRAWDHHDNIEKSMPNAARETDQATAGLLLDLQQRGLLDETLIIWGGEFGRTPMGQGSGRDHHINAFTLLMAGGGIKGGVVFGKSDELGYGVAENKVSVHDIHATMLRLLGINDSAFTYKYQGLDFKLSGVEPARVLKEILA
jgi:hypothetical protein